MKYSSLGERVIVSAVSAITTAFASVSGKARTGVSAAEVCARDNNHKLGYWIKNHGGLKPKDAMGKERGYWIVRHSGSKDGNKSQQMLGEWIIRRSTSLTLGNNFGYWIVH